jgi:Pyrimidine reductase, riboflavin biosynthesis
VLKDDPELTVRMVKGKNPIRLILDSHLSLTPDYKVFQVDETKQTIIFCGENAPKEREKIFVQRGVEVVRLPCGENGEVDLKALLSYCQDRGITSVLVEGGGKVHGSFLKEGLYDEVFFMYGPMIMGDPLGVSAVNAKPLTNLNEATRLFQIKIKRFGNSILIHGLTESGLDLIQKAVKNSIDNSSS